MTPALDDALAQFGLQVGQLVLDKTLLPTLNELTQLLGRLIVERIHPPTLVELTARGLRNIATRWGAEWPPAAVADEQDWFVRQLLTDAGGRPNEDDVATLTRLAALKNRDPNQTL